MDNLSTGRATSAPALALYVQDGDFTAAIAYLKQLSRDELYDTLLYSGLGVHGLYPYWIKNIESKLALACHRGYLESTLTGGFNPKFVAANKYASNM
ncbi:hypothetical protein [Catenovulum sediminis]|uniref:Uncharacterized protein n=1 Tax=Catenovulum sediminis TaxID=1740262 RepID=A0ABV1RFU8_9ALTE|nr:hypothetical protein [Catenovulum sediminis]